MRSGWLGQAGWMQSQRVAKYQPYLNELNCEGLMYPVKAADKQMIDTFEVNNNIFNQHLFL